MRYVRMRIFGVILVFTLIAVAPTLVYPHCPNVVTNGDFSGGTAPWIFYTDGVGTYSVVGGEAKLAIIIKGTNVQFYQRSLLVQGDTLYRLTFKARHTTGADVIVRLIKHAAPYTNLGLNQTFDLTDTMKTFSIEFTTPSGGVAGARLMFFVGSHDQGGTDYFFDDVVLEKVDCQVSDRIVNCDDGDVLQDAIDAARPETRITVLGTCTENIVIHSWKQNLIIDGAFSASIVAAENNKPAVRIRGRDITIENFSGGQSISGGSNAIRIESASAVIDNNTIESATRNGIDVAEKSFAVIHGNKIWENGRNGIALSGGSTAEIGNCTPLEANRIEDNGRSGVVLNQHSEATIFGNRISDNAEVGIRVADGSMADTGSNTISGNIDGVDVLRGSSVRLGKASGTGCVETPNTDGGNANTGFGIECASLSTVDGRLGDLGTFATAELRDDNADCPNCCFTSLADQPPPSP